MLKPIDIITEECKKNIGDYKRHYKKEREEREKKEEEEKELRNAEEFHVSNNDENAP
jgi:hypothetical protein